MADKHCIPYDSDTEDAFIVHSHSGIIKFERTPDGLYVYRPTAKFKKGVAASKGVISPNDFGGKRTSNMITTVKENKMSYTQRQFESTRRAQRLYHIVRCPTIENFKHILRQNIIKNCPVTPEDVNIAKKLFGGDIRAMKGKTTR